MQHVWESTEGGNDADILDEFPRTSRFCLDRKITDISNRAMAGGGYSDIWTGKLNEKLVAVKMMREFSVPVNLGARNKLFRRIWREYMTWAKLSHPNILPFLGYTHDFTQDSTFKLPALVSPWMGNGTLATYIVNNPQVNRSSLILGVGRALEYLHAHGIVHGDLRAGNVLVSEDGKPFVTDFGLSRILSETFFGLTTTTQAAGSLRWMAPELLYNAEVDEDQPPTQQKVCKASDVWAYGMTMLEVLSKKNPYGEIQIDGAVFGMIIQGKLPNRPSLTSAPELTDDVWNICLACWDHRPDHRPSMSKVMLGLLAGGSQADGDTAHIAVEDRRAVRLTQSRPASIALLSDTEKKLYIWKHKDAAYTGMRRSRGIQRALKEEEGIHCITEYVVRPCMSSI
ncbi:hypothetical protein M422DRAFT_219746 [Sphaerobolus stellatus SS14]|nr:hypothetical protein M422DRAFT_219746 [Sphaerobolus stellatus SS14]